MPQRNIITVQIADDYTIDYFMTVHDFELLPDPHTGETIFKAQVTVDGLCNGTMATFIAPATQGSDIDSVLITIAKTYNVVKLEVEDVVQSNVTLGSDITSI